MCYVKEKNKKSYDNREVLKENTNSILYEFTKESIFHQFTESKYLTSQREFWTKQNFVVFIKASIGLQQGLLLSTQLSS